MQVTQTKLNVRPAITDDEMVALLNLMHRLDLGDNVGAFGVISDFLDANRSPRALAIVHGIQPWPSFIGGDDATAGNVASLRYGNPLADECALAARSFASRPKVEREKVGPRRREWLTRSMARYMEWMKRAKYLGFSDRVLMLINQNHNFAVAQYNALG